MTDCWRDAAEGLAAELALLRPGQFVVVECAVDLPADDYPYAQAARSVDGWYCEVVSQTYLPAHTWPIDEVVLRRLGWSPPGDGDNWHRDSALTADVANRLLAALRYGRACPEASRLTWWVGTFPSGPDDGERTDTPEAALLKVAA